MEWLNPNSFVQLHGLSRIVSLLGSVLVALSSGTNYIYSAYAPQLGARLKVSHTQLNVIGLAGNMGVYTSGPVWGRIVDRKGPRIPLIGASICLFVGYIGIKQMYDDGLGNENTVLPLHLALLVACSFMTGLGGNAGLGAALNVTAKSFSSSARATTTGIVLSGFGLSAFWFSLLGHTLFPGDASGFLLVLAVGTAIPMLIGLFIVKPVPLESTSAHAAIEGYDSLPSAEGVVCVGEGQVHVDPDSDAEAGVETDSVPLLSHERRSDSCHVPITPSSVALQERSISDKDVPPDIHGKQLWLTPDFYLIFVIMAICSGTGLMYINNVGSISQALYAETHEVYDDLEASHWQAAQVSILSLGNFAGRILIGLISDCANVRFHLPRAYCLCIVSSLFIVSQLSAIIVSTVETLWVATLLSGLAYGSLFGIYPTIMIEWFGIAHFSENWGYVSFSPVLGGNLFSLMFGLYLDAHASPPDMRSPIGVHALASLQRRLVMASSRELPSEHQCLDGKVCYVGSLQVTLVACVVSLVLSWWAGIRDERKVKARHAST